jgi:hypothetical protein
MRLDRPYIPLAIRVKVAERQADAKGYKFGSIGFSNKERLATLLTFLFGETVPELHHRPALINRDVINGKGGIRYEPEANDPEYLVYLDPQAHDIETRVRGVGAQFSDLAQVRRRKAKIRKAKRPKYKWASRPFRSLTRGGPDGQKEDRRKRKRKYANRQAR